MRPLTIVIQYCIYVIIYTYVCYYYIQGWTRQTLIVHVRAIIKKERYRNLLLSFTYFILLSRPYRSTT